MTRDATNQVEDDTRTITGERPLGTVVTTSSSVASRQRSRNGRSDSVPTERSADGTYHLPTNYTACFSTTMSSPGEMRYAQRGLTVGAGTTYYTHSWDGRTDNDLWRYGCTNPGPSPGQYPKPNVPQSIISGARNSVLGKIRHQDLDLGAFLAELPSTVQTIIGILKDVKKLAGLARRPIRSLQHVTVAGIRSAASKRTADEYLRYMYGVRPLITDAHALLSNIENGFAHSNLCYARSRVTDPDFAILRNWPYWRDNEVWLTGKLERGCKVECAFALSNPVAYELWRYGLTNPLSIAWELTTLSFVIDWFTGMGAFLNALQQPLGLRYKWGFETQFLEIKATRYEDVYRTSNLDTNSRNTLLKEGIAQTYVQTKTMSRVVGVGFPVPVPYLELDLNLSQVGSLIALAIPRR